MRILFCDDDPVILQQLQKYVREYFHINALELPEFVAYSDGDTLLDTETARADIAFLDVEIPGRSGIHVGAKLMERNPKIKVFIVTSHMEYLDEAMRFRVFRYLYKPVNPNQLYINLKDALYQYHLETTEIPVETKAGMTVYTTDEILCIESKQNKAILYTTYGTIEPLHGLPYWKQLLDIPCFYQTYRGFIVNMKYVVSFDKTVVHLKYEEIKLTAYLARRKHTEFKKRFLLYKGSVR